MPIIPDDPYLWLEEVTDEKALDWVRAHNEVTLKLFQGHHDFESLKEQLLAIYQSDKRIPAIYKAGDYFYNFWRDKEHIRGIFRRTTLAEYKKEQSEWDIILDLDKLAESENENWVWAGADWLPHKYERCILAFSRGGGDAKVFREFDVNTRQFVTDGFILPESKGGPNWRNIDEVFVSTDFGPDSMTKSGYPRLVKLWKRGTPLAEAKLVYEAREEDILVRATHDHTPGFSRDIVHLRPTFFSEQKFFLTDTGLVKIDVPDSAGKSPWRDFLIIYLREPWVVNDFTYEVGTLLMANLDEYMAGKRDLSILFAPTPRSSIDSFGYTKDYIYLNILEDVQNRIEYFKITDPDRVRTPLAHIKRCHTVEIEAVDEDESNDYFLFSSSYLTPRTVFLGTLGGEIELLKALPSFFDASEHITDQYFAASADGTQIPYFIVKHKDCELDGNNPTLLYGYGGFLNSELPYYSATMGTAWLSQGGIYVVANIRGGAEYGPRWHSAALKANRFRAYEDFAAVAQDLVSRGLTCPRRLGAWGGSNGGLLVGNMATLYPNLFHAIVCNVPLLDMLRYHKLLAGASWVEEYGDPENEEDAKHLQIISPYHNVKADVKYPRILFLTSTRDDRVHPGHARKMVAKMCEQGHNVLYYENTEGGHAGVANTLQESFVSSLIYTFLKRELFEKA